jgi:polar amino acid transport system substrate-binding protein
MLNIAIKPNVFLLLLTLSFWTTSHLTAQDDLLSMRTAGVVRIGVKAHAPPFSEKIDERLVGFDVSIAQAIASYLELELELVPLGSSQRIPFLKENKVDLILATMTVTRSREKQVDFSTPYFEDGQSLLCLKSGAIQSYQDLKDKVVGAVAGTTTLKNFPQIQPLAEIKAFPSAGDAVDAMLKGEIQAFSSDMLMLMGLKLNHAQGDQLEVRGGKFTTEPYGVAMRQNQSNLRDLVNEAIMVMWTSGTWKTMYDKWFGEGSLYQHENNFAVKVVN